MYVLKLCVANANYLHNIWSQIQKNLLKPRPRRPLQKMLHPTLPNRTIKGRKLKNHPTQKKKKRVKASIAKVTTTKMMISWTIQQTKKYEEKPEKVVEEEAMEHQQQKEPHKRMDSPNVEEDVPGNNSKLSTSLQKCTCIVHSFSDTMRCCFRC